MEILMAKDVIIGLLKICGIHTLLILIICYAIPLGFAHLYPPLFHIAFPVFVLLYAFCFHQFIYIKGFEYGAIFPTKDSVKRDKADIQYFIEKIAKLEGELERYESKEYSSQSQKLRDLRNQIADIEVENTQLREQING